MILVGHDIDPFVYGFKIYLLVLSGVNQNQKSRLCIKFLHHQKYCSWSTYDVSHWTNICSLFTFSLIFNKRSPVIRTLFLRPSCFSLVHPFFRQLFWNSKSFQMTKICSSFPCCSTSSSINLHGLSSCSPEWSKCFRLDTIRHERSVCITWLHLIFNEK